MSTQNRVYCSGFFLVGIAMGAVGCGARHHGRSEAVAQPRAANSATMLPVASTDKPSAAPLPAPAPVAAPAPAPTAAPVGSGDAAAARPRPDAVLQPVNAHASPWAALPAPRDATLSAGELVARSNAFGAALWALMPAEGNLALSPLSYTAAMLMVAGGAHGETATEFSRVFHLQDVKQAHATAWADVIRGISSSGAQVAVANKLYVQRGRKLQPAFAGSVHRSFAAKVVAQDFTHVEQARDAINLWVQQHTMGMIRQLLPPQAIDGSTRLVAVNALAFLGKWAHAFKKSDTREAPFWLNSTDRVMVKMMQQTTRLRTARLDHGAAVALPYRGGRLEMWALLPTETKDLQALQSELGTLGIATLATRFASATPREILVELPRFRIKTPANISHNAILGSLGLATAFRRCEIAGPGCGDFSGMLAGAPLAISQVVHQAVVEVEEAGTKAAAATAVVVSTIDSLEPRTGLRFDRPFVFLIVDTKTQSVLFMGRVADPTKE